MGEKNSFRFDPVTATWKSDDDMDEPDNDINGIGTGGGPKVYEGKGVGNRIGSRIGTGDGNGDEEREEEGADRRTRGGGRAGGSYDDVYEEAREGGGDGRGGGWPLRDGSALSQGQGLGQGLGVSSEEDFRNGDDDTLHSRYHDQYALHGSRSSDDGDGSSDGGGSAFGGNISSSPSSSSHPFDFHHRSSPSAPSSSSAIKMSPHVFLLVISMYFLSCLVESGTHAVNITYPCNHRI